MSETDIVSGAPPIREPPDFDNEPTNNSGVILLEVLEAVD